MLKDRRHPSDQHRERSGRIGLFFGAASLLILLFADRIWVILTEESNLKSNVATTYFSFRHNAASRSNEVETKRAEKFCEDLVDHSAGHWSHHFAFYNNMSDIIDANPSILSAAFPITNETLTYKKIRTMYLPEEMMWLRGLWLPPNFDPNSPKRWDFGIPNCRQKADDDEQRGISYLSTIGNQCGCTASQFQPSHSYWLSRKKALKNTTENQKVKNIPINDSPSLRLAKEFARKNQTVCFAGDSIDFQFYNAFRNNLLRAESLHQHHFNRSILSMTTRRDPVHYSTNGTSLDRSKHYRMPDDFWMLAKEIWVSEVTFHDEERQRFVFKYLLHYQWAPWLYEQMDTCDVMIMNQCLHYTAFPPWKDMFEDTKAAITYLANFSASSNDRVAIWRTTLPQHFATPKGQYIAGVENCVEINQEYRKSNEKQDFYPVNERAFSHLCQPQNTSCGNFQRTCTVDTKTTDLFTVYAYWVANNLTSELDYVKDMESNVTGDILIWELFDLFDVPMWHAQNTDCTHFCYVPALYESAFQRLELLLKLAS